jgi:uncharacterized membrane protein YfcA
VESAQRQIGFVMLPVLPVSLALGSGGVIGLVLGLIGGGGSILAVPLLIYVVGVGSPHVAIGTAAIAVAVNALVGLSLHAKRGAVRWPCALVFSVAGVAGALAGAAAGKAMDGGRLLTLFGLVMILVGALMLRPKPTASAPSPWLSRETAPLFLPRLAVLGAGVGLLSGFFGIGGGFLIVPGLMLAVRMDLKEATSASLIAVSAFALASASSYAWSGLVDWPVAGLLIAGGAAGAFLGTRLNTLLAGRKRLLTAVFAWIVVCAGLYVSVRGTLTFIA